MNISYRNLWNPNLGTWVAAPENARGRGRGGRRALTATALACLLAGPLLAPQITWADGSGGRGGGTGPGGVGSAGTRGDGGSGAWIGAGSDGTAGSGSPTPGGGYGGSDNEVSSGNAPAANGGNGGTNVGTSGQSNTGALVGGGGGGGGTSKTADPSANASDVNGGNGGAGLTLSGSYSNTETGRITGGGGGGGGSSRGTGGSSANSNGGSGGVGVAWSAGSGSTLSNAGTITGGGGGSAGTSLVSSTYNENVTPGSGGAGVAWSAGSGSTLFNTGTIAGGNAGGGYSFVGSNSGLISDGTGGAGVSISGGGGTIRNTGTIAGGNGNSGSEGGTGGVGIVASGGGVTVINSGTVQGGLSGTGMRRANAIEFSGSNNTLELQAGYSVIGNVAAGSGTNNVLVLGGSANASFVASDIGSGAAYSGFTSYQKTGNSTWTLTGPTTAVTPWTLTAGTLAIADDASLGAASGALTFNGGTLQTTATTTSARDVTLAAAGGSFNTDSGTTYTLGGLVSGAGTLIKTGGGTLSLAGASTYTGGTLVSSGTLQGNTTSLQGNIENNARLTFAQAINGSYAGTLSGTGLLTKSGNGTLTLTAANTYTGGTTVEAGTLRAGSAGAFVQNTAYTVNGGTLDLGGHNLVASTLSGTGGTVALGAGSLTVDQSTSTSYAGTVSGSGSLVKGGTGTLAMSGTGTYTGGTQVLAGRLNLGSNTALGTGTLDLADGTTLGFTADGLRIVNNIFMSGVGDPVIDTGSFSETLAGAISGGGFLTKEGSGTLTLAGANSYTGATLVNAGTLQAGAANSFSPLSATTVAAGATLDLAGYSQTVAGITNAGTVSLRGSTPGTVLTVTGPWVGNGGTLVLSTALGGNASVADRLVLSGGTAVASGSTRVAVTNLGGLGGQTTGAGIEIISAQNGASINAGAFTLAARVAAGAYEYSLNTTSTGGYLSSSTTTPMTPIPTPASPAATAVPTYRAEVPLYAALPEQLRQANLAMLGNLRQRVGDDGVSGTNTVTADAGSRQAWGRVISTERDIRQGGTVSPTSQGRLTGFQAGTELWVNAHWRTGIYVGQLNGDMSVTGFARGIVNYAAGSNDLRSQYLGAYASWKNDSGLYVDSVLQGGRHRYSVNPAVTYGSGGKGDSLLASVELGQAFHVAPNWVVEPQLQLVHQRLSLNDSTIVGALVRQDSDSGWTARAGVRIKGQIDTVNGTLQPYAQVNVYKRSSGTDVARFIGPAAYSDIATGTGGTSSELVAGATWQLSQRTSVYGEIGKLWASGDDARTGSGVNGSLGVKVRW